MRNKYIFDYRLVLEEDPSFKKFVYITKKELTDNDYHIDYTFREPAVETGNKQDNDIINLVHNKEKKSDYLDFSNEKDQVFIHNFNGEPIEDIYVDLKFKYKYATEKDISVKYNKSIPQLVPPNRFLMPNSKVWQNDHNFYAFKDSHEFDHRKFICYIFKTMFSQKNNFIRLQKAVYRFDRKRNVTSELKKHLAIFTYNTTTKQLYKITNKKNNILRARSHYHKKVINTFNTLINTNWSSTDSLPISNKFYNEILKAAKKDVPDIVTLNKEETIKIISNYGNSTYTRIDDFQTLDLMAIILQHKIGKPLKWINYILLKNIASILGNVKFLELAMNGRYDPISSLKILKLKRQTIYKFVPNLKKNNRMSDSIKTLVGKHCNKFIIKLFNLAPINLTFLYLWTYAMEHHLISKNLYHFVSNSVHAMSNYAKNIRGYSIGSFLENMCTILYSLVDIDEDEKGKDTKLRSINSIIDSYIKMCKKIPTGLPRWNTWHDLYRMANQLGIRLRPNKFTYNKKIKYIHDKFSSIINRDRFTIKKYKNEVFEEFKSPNKKYDGFEFIQMRTAKDLIEEGTTMKHCVGSYTDRCVEGYSIIFSMRKDGKSYVTIELNTKSYLVKQQYTILDYTVDNETILNIIDRWNKDCLELHKDDKESYRDVCTKKINEKIKASHIEDIKDLAKEDIFKDVMGGDVMRNPRRINNFENNIIDVPAF